MPDHLDLESLRSSGPAEGEQLQPEEPAAAGAAAAAPAAAAAAAPVPDATIVAQLVSMGFSENGSKRAGERCYCAVHRGWYKFGEGHTSAGIVMMWVLLCF